MAAASAATPTTPVPTSWISARRWPDYFAFCGRTRDKGAKGAVAFAADSGDSGRPPQRAICRVRPLRSFSRVRKRVRTTRVTPPTMTHACPARQTGKLPRYLG